jgi:hypothetical protein
LEEYNPMRKISAVLVFFIAGFLCFSSVSWSQKSSEWELEVSTEKADVHLVPDTDSTVVITLPKGFLLKSYEKINEWFRIVIGPDEDGIVTIGYIQSQNVDVIREKIVQELDYWEEEPEFFKGIGLSVKLTGGPTFFSGGDIRKGDQGLYDAASDLVTSYGFVIEKRFNAFRSGFEVVADFVYNLTSRFGVGIGAGYVRLTQQSLLLFNEQNTVQAWNQAGTAPKVTAYPIRLGVFFNFPLHRLVNLTLDSGAALYITEYTYSRHTNWFPIDLINHKANATGIGFHGGVGFEINFHRRAAFILEGRGRYAKISGFNGKGNIRKSVLPPFQYDDIEENGTLYYLEENGHPFLAFFEQEPTGYETVRKATLDLSGFIFQAGIKVKF